MHSIEGYFVFVVTVIVFMTFQFCILIMCTSKGGNNVCVGENSAKDWGTKNGNILHGICTCCSKAPD